MMMNCTWRKTPDGPRCGQPANGWRTQFSPYSYTAWYCPRHLSIIRRMTPDDEARRQGIHTGAPR